MEKLTEKERDRLIELHRRERDGSARDRIKSVLAYDSGYPYSDIAKVLLLDEEIIKQYMEEYRNSKNGMGNRNRTNKRNLLAQETKELMGHPS